MRAGGLAMEQADANGEDPVEAALSEVDVLERGDDELGPTRLDIPRVAATGGGDHLRRAVNGGESASIEALTDKGGGDSLPAADLQHPVVWPDLQLLDDRAEPLVHDAA